MKKYIIAEVNATKIDGGNVKFLSTRPGMKYTTDVASEFIKTFDSIEEAQKEVEYANQCVVEAKWL